MNKRVWVDPRFADHPLVRAAIAEHHAGDDVKAPRFPIELTDIGEQYLIPGCEKRAADSPSRPTQMQLWDGKR